MAETEEKGKEVYVAVSAPEEKVDEEQLKGVEGEVVHPENKDLANEVTREEEKLKLDIRKRDVDDKRVAFEKDMSLAEAFVLKEQVEADAQSLVENEKEFEDDKEARVKKFKEYVNRISELEAVGREKDTLITNLTEMVGGEKKAKAKLTEKEKDEERANAIKRFSEIDKTHYPHIDDIPEGIEILNSIGKIVGRNGEIKLQRFLNKWAIELSKFATYTIVKSTTNRKEDIIKAETETQRKRHRVRKNYSWAIDIFKTCNDVLLDCMIKYQESDNGGSILKIFSGKTQSDNSKLFKKMGMAIDLICRTVGINDGRDDRVLNENTGFLEVRKE